MKRRTAIIIGVILILVGAIASLYIALGVVNARITGIFATSVTDSPTNRFESLRCPLLASVGETVSVVAIIRNPTSDDLDYSMQIEAPGFHVQSPDRELKASVPGNQATQVNWVLTMVEPGRQAIAVQALSSQDLALPGPFHSWPTSFRQGCGVLVTSGPLTGQQILFFGLASILVGAGILLPSVRAAKEPQE